jgi:hypothetical protein
MKMTLTTWIEDDSSVIDAIETAKAAWFEAHPECDVATSEKTDECINRALDLPASGSLRPLADQFEDWTEAQIASAVASGLDEWWGRADVRFRLLVAYSAPPPAKRFEFANLARLQEIKEEIDACEPDPHDRTGWECDYEACGRALEIAAQDDNYKSVYVAQDEDGYYFATTR